MIKSAELAFRRWFNRWFQSDKKPVAVSRVHNTFSLSAESRILFLRQDRIGDVLISTPVLDAIRTAYPKAQIGIVLSSNNIAVRNAAEPYVNIVHVYSRTAPGLASLIREIRKKKYDVVVDLMDNPSATSGVICRFSGARYRLGITKENDGVYTHVVPMLPRDSVHISRRIAELLKPFGVDPEKVSLIPRYPITPFECDGAKVALGTDVGTGIRLGVVASGSSNNKQYPAGRMAGVLNTLIKSHPSLKVYLFADPKNYNWVGRVESLTPAKPAPYSATFHDAAVQMSAMDVVLTPDTSFVHVAGALGLPVCVMYIQPHQDLYPWYPLGARYEALITKTNQIADIPESEIVAAIERLFAYCGHSEDNHEL